MNSQPSIQPIPHYQRLRALDQILNLGRKDVDDAQHKYQQTLEQFATLCHEFWQREKAQGNHQGKGFRQSLQAAGINVRRAYRAMKKFFPADFPTRPKSLKKQKIPALCGAHKADVCSTGELIEGYEGYEILECKFALTPEDKTEFFAALELVDRSQVWPLLLDAVKQAARQAKAIPESPAREGFDFAPDGADAIPAKPQTLSDNNQSCTPSEDNDYPGFLDQYNEITDPLADSPVEGLERLTHLHDSLQLREPHDDLPGLAAMFTPEELHAKLDWMDSCPGWRIGVHGATGLEFDRIFELVPADGSPPPS